MAFENIYDRLCAEAYQLMRQMAQDWAVIRMSPTFFLELFDYLDNSDGLALRLEITAHPRRLYSIPIVIDESVNGYLIDEQKD